MCKSKKKSWYEGTYNLLDRSTNDIASDLHGLPCSVLTALYRALTKMLSRYHCEPNLDSIWSVADELRYWNVCSFSYFHGKSGVGIHFEFFPINYHCL